MQTKDKFSLYSMQISSKERLHGSCFHCILEMAEHSDSLQYPPSQETEQPGEESQNDLIARTQQLRIIQGN